MVVPLLFIACLAPITSAAVPAVTVTNNAKQTITSFGASGAWWPNDLINFPEDVQANMSRLLFSPDYMHLSSYRYNMGANGGPNDTRQSGAMVESFMLENGTYDWSRDHGGVTFLKYAQENALPYITFFINAAPSHIASNHQACGYDLEKSAIPAFADYITTVLSYWTDHGIDIKYISPMNEPDNNRADCGQEGMGVAPAIRPDVFSAIRSSQRTTSARHVGVIGDETSQLVQADAEYPIWLAAGAPSLSNIAIHNYDYPSDSDMAKWYNMTLNLTSGHPPPVKFTETCCATTSGNGPGVFGGHNDPTMTNALIVARYIWQFLTIADAVSFDWWTAGAGLPCSPTIDGMACATEPRTNGYSSGLIYYDPQYKTTGDYTLYLTKRFWMMRHFAHYIRPGAVRYAMEDSQLPNGVEVLVTREAETTRPTKPLWSTTFFNNQTSVQPVELRLDPHLPTSGSPPVVVTTAVTDNDNDFAESTAGPQFTTCGGTHCLLANLTSQSITTFRFLM